MSAKAFPPIKLNLEHLASRDGNNEASSRRLKNVPIIPPKPMFIPVKLNIDHENSSACWYIVQTPREVRGVGGPFTLTEMAEMYRNNDINDSTLVWQEGEENWISIRYHDFLRPKLIYMPKVPIKVRRRDSVNDGELIAYDQLSQSKPLDNYRLEYYCSKCGSLGACQLPSDGKDRESLPDLKGNTSATASTDAAVEVIPNFLYIGNLASSKKFLLKDLSITLSINCTKEIPTNESNNLYCRWKTFPLKEKPTMSDYRNPEKFLTKLTQVYNWIEYERLQPERIMSVKQQHDEKEKQEHIDTHVLGYDKKQQPVPLNYDVNLRQGRILLWSRLGYDRCVFVAIAYLMKRYSLSVQSAIDHVTLKRQKVDLSPIYLTMLQCWAATCTYSTIFCNDCISTFVEAKNGATESKEHEDELLYHPLSQLLLTHDYAHHDKFQSLCYPNTYIEKILSSQEYASPWSGLCDLQIPGRLLGNEILVILFHSLSQCQLLQHLRVINISGNEIDHVSLEVIVELIIHSSTQEKILYDDIYRYNHAVAIPELRMRDKSHLCPYELYQLDLSNNALGEEAANIVSKLLRHCNSIVSLDIHNNKINDVGGKAIFHTFLRPAGNYFNDFTLNDDHNSSHPHLPHPPLPHREDDHGSITTKNSSLSQHSSSPSPNHSNHPSPIHTSRRQEYDINTMYNSSLTDIDISNNLIGDQTGDMIISCFKSNYSLNRLNISMNKLLSANTMKHLTNTLREYNCTMEYFICNEMPLTRRVIDGISNMATKGYNRLKQLELANCQISSNFLRPFHDRLALCRYLTYLKLGHNPLGNTGAKILANSIYREDTAGFAIKNSSIKHLELNSCNITFNGFRYLFSAIKGQQVIEYLDISGNYIESNDNMDDEDDYDSVESEALLYSLTTNKRTGGGMSGLASAPMTPTAVNQYITKNTTKKKAAINLHVFFTDILCYCKLKTLKMNNCKISAQFGILLFDLLANSFHHHQQWKISNQQKTSEIIPMGLFSMGKDHPATTTANATATSAIQSSSISRMPSYYSLLSENEYSLSSAPLSVRNSRALSINPNPDTNNNSEILAVGGQFSAKSQLQVSFDFNSPPRTPKMSANPSKGGFSSLNSSTIEEQTTTNSTTSNSVILQAVDVKLPAPEDCIYHSLQCLYLSSNNLNDMTAEYLVRVIDRNIVLQHIDIGFNKFSKDANLRFKNVTNIHSSSDNYKKVLDLNVVLIGNECDPYALELPNRTRAKNLFRYGISPSKEDIHRQGYSHISDIAKEHYFHRKLNFDMFRNATGSLQTNQIN